MKVIPLVSGGIDSTVLMFREVMAKGNEIYPFTVNYGQKNINREVIALKTCYSVLFKRATEIQKQKIKPIKYIDASTVKPIFKSGITWDEIEVPDHDEWNGGNDDKTFVPFRNVFLISMAVAYADLIGAEQILIGSHKGAPGTAPAHMDSTTVFMDQMSKVVEMGNNKNIKLKYPFSQIEKWEIVKMGSILGVPLQLTYGCYRSHKYPCGKCAACFGRRKAFKDANVTDETIYLDDPRAKKGCCG